MCRLRDDLLPSLCVLQDRPSAQSQRWNISKPWVPFLLCFVQTWPSFRTGLQILDQKWRAQQSPSAQSDDLRQFSPSIPLKTKQHSWILCTTFTLKTELILNPRLINKFFITLLTFSSGPYTQPKLYLISVTFLKCSCLVMQQRIKSFKKYPQTELQLGHNNMEYSEAILQIHHSLYESLFTF